MTVWSFATKSVQAFFNFSFGQYFSQPLREDQVIVTRKGIGCKDVYFNIERLNAVVAERGIPIVLCVAYVAEIIVCLPWSVEIHGIDFVIQAVSGRCSPVENDHLLHSMISSMTAAAFAAVKVVNGVDHWPNIDADIAEAESSTSEAKGYGLWSWVQNLFDKMTTTLEEEVNFEKEDQNSLVDYESKKRLALMLDSFIAQTTVILRDVTIRIECQLGLPNMDRASSLTLCLGELLLTNQQSDAADSNAYARRAGKAGAAESKPDCTSTTPGGQSKVDPSDGWSWFRWWRRKPADPLVTASTGSLFTMMHKIVRLDSADIFWDLWDTSQAGQSHQSADRQSPSTLPPSELDCDVAADSKLLAYGPTTENIVASSKLISLSGGDNTARISMCCPLLSALTSTQQGSATAMAPVTTLGDSASFQLRVYLDLGPLVACACPSQFYWLRLMLGQLVRISEDYADQLRLRQGSSLGRQAVSPPANPWQPGYETYRRPHPSESDLVDLDLSSLTHQDGARSGGNVSMIDSKLFWSCVTDDPLPQEMTFVDMESSTTTTNTVIHSDPVHQETKTKLQFSLAANVLSTALVVFYEDESLSPSAASSPTEEAPGATGTNSHLTELSQLAGGVNSSSLLRSVIGPSPAGRSRERCESTSTTSDHQSEVGREEEEEAATSESSATELPANGSARDIDFAALPGPSLFFARYHGFLPWRQQVFVPPANDQATNGPPVDDENSVFTARPMRIDRQEVDTGRMNPAAWVADLRRQFAQLAAPRDHICLVGGLWRVEMCSRSVTSTRTSAESQVIPRQGHALGGDRREGSAAAGQTVVNLSQLDINAQLFGVELSECLFEESKEQVEVTAENSQPVFVELLTFPDRLRTGSDRLVRSPGNPAIELSLLFHLPPTSTPAASFPLDSETVNCSRQFRGSTRLETPTPPCDRYRLGLGVCRLEVDVSLSDRLHRVVDALAAAGEAVVKWMPVSSSASWNNSPPTRSKVVAGGFDGRDEFRGLEVGLANWPTPRANHFISTSKETLMDSPQMSRCPTSRELRTNSDLQVECHACELVLRFPVPLEAIKLEPSQKLSDMRCKLWSSGIPFWLDPDQATDRQGGTCQGLAWWRHTLRPEYLRICLDKVKFSHHQMTITGGEGVRLAAGHPVTTATSFRLPSHKAGRGDGKLHPIGLADDEEAVKRTIELSLHCVSVWLCEGDGSRYQHPEPFLRLSGDGRSSDPITLSLSVAQPGRQELIEQSDEPPVVLTDYYPDQPVASTTTGQRQCFEVGVDLARAHELFATSQSAGDVEWVLWKRMGPRQNRRTPLVVRRNFLQDAIKAHSKQTTYYPGDSDHMRFYRRWASSHTWLSLKCRLPVASVNVTSKRLVDVVYFRVFYDLLLWSSLLPNDRRLRATLARYRGRQSSTGLGETSQVVKMTMAAGDSRRMDHCYWFLSDPAPLASIYAHPEAAREAARLEANSVRHGGDLLHSAGQYPGGLHFLPMESDDDESEMEATANGGAGGWRDSRSTTAFIYDGPSRGAARYGSHPPSPRRSGNNSVSQEDQLDETCAQTTTAVQRQSLVCVYINVGQLEACVTLPPAATAGSGQVDDFVRLSASRADFFVELGHNGEAEVNYATAEVAGCNVFFTANHLRPGVQHQSTANDQAGQIWWPGLVDISSNPLGFPAKSSTAGAYEEDVSPSGVGSSGSTSSTAGPVLSLALEHRHSRHVTSGGSNTPGYLDDFVLALRLQNACLAHWPSLDADVCGPCAASGSSAMPLWLSRLLQMLEIPSGDRLSQVLPAYVMPDTLLIQHIHLERVAFVWSHRESLASGLGGQTTNATASVSGDPKRQVRGLLSVESISLTLNSVSETVPGSGDTGDGSAASDLINPTHGMLIMAFLSNLAVFLCPVPRGLLPSMSETLSPGSSATSLPSALFSRWLQSLDLAECVCVTDLDHLEARCFIDTMKVPTKKQESALVSRVDLRATNNLLRMSTCADSLAVLQCLAESLYSPPIRCAACQAVSSRLASTDDDLLWLDDSRNVSLRNAESSVEDLLQNAISDVNVTPDKRRGNPSSASSRDSAPWKSRPGRLKKPHVKALYPVIQSEDKDSRSRDETSPTSSEEFVMVSQSDCVPQSSLGDCADRVRVMATDADAYSLVEDFYAMPNALPDRQSVAGGEAGRRSHSTKHLFIDPPAVYPRANVAVTLYNFSLEWNIYGGHDLALSGLPNDRCLSPSPTSPMTGASAAAASDARPSPWKPAKSTDSPSSRAETTLSIPARVLSGYRFRHDLSSADCLSSNVSLNTGKSRGRGVLAPAPTIAYIGGSQSENNPGELMITTSLRSLYNRGGKNRDVQKAISIRLANIYFRHATFPPGAGPRRDRQPGQATGPGTGASSRPGQPASRHVLKIGSVVVLDQVATSNINQLLYTYTPPVSGCHVLHNSRTPVFRAAVLCHRVDTLGDRLPGAAMAAPSDRLSLELEAQVSIQPLRINLDQNTLSFLGEFQQSFANHCSLLLPLACESDQGSRASVRVHGCHGDQQLPMVDDAGSIFIRKVTFYPDLPIRLDYHGRKLDLSTGSLHGILQMLLQINNGELVIPRRVYQRGYPTVEKLLEEIIDDLWSTVKSQLPQMLVTSVGPMCEVSQFILGLWDLIYQPIHSVYKSTRTPTIRELFMSPAGSQVDLAVRERRTSGSSSSATGGTTAFMHGLKRGTRSFSASTLWAALQLSIQGVRAVQSVAETAYDLVTPGPALRSRQLRLRQPADLREGFGNAVTAMSRGLQMVTEDLCGATRLAQVDVGYGANKGPVGIVGDVLRQVPPTIVAPMVTGCEVTANILGGFRNQLHPEAKLEDEQKWKDTHGL